MSVRMEKPGVGRPQGRTADERGFTLIELLVVILIIGILAAVAIPSLLNQRSKASDASAKALANTAALTAVTYGTDNGGSYVNLSPTILAKYESTIVTAAGSGAYIGPTGATGTSTTYSVTATSTNGDTFTIATSANGSETRSCTTAVGNPVGGCLATGSW